MESLQDQEDGAFAANIRSNGCYIYSSFNIFRYIIKYFSSGLLSISKLDVFE